MVHSLVLPLSTSRLVLRDFRADDGDAVYAYASDPDVTQFMFYGPRTRAETHQYLSQILATQNQTPRMTWELAIVLQGQDRPIGACDLTLENEREGDLGYILGRETWGHGFATEVATALVEAGFEHLGLARIFAICDIKHTASARVLEKAGLTRKAVLEQYREAKGRWWDMYLYDLKRSDWVQPIPQTAR
jgi:[ribosomal protein S5]-alanine N-acetyltransferase